MSPQTMTHLPADWDPGRVRRACRRFPIGVLLGLALVLLPGCYEHFPRYPDEIRARESLPLFARMPSTAPGLGARSF